MASDGKAHTGMTSEALEALVRSFALVLGEQSAENDIDLRLECLRLAYDEQLAPADVVKAASLFYEFVTQGREE